MQQRTFKISTPFTKDELGILNNQLQTIQKIKTENAELKEINAQIKNPEEKKSENAAIKAAEEKVSDIIGQVLWETVIADKSIPNSYQRPELLRRFEGNLRLGLEQNITNAILSKITTNLEILENLHSEIQQAADSLKTISPSLKDTLLDAKKLAALKTESANDIHRKWQRDFKSDPKNKPYRFKPCVMEKDKSLDKAYDKLRDLKEGEKYLKENIYPKLSKFGAFKDLYQYNNEKKIWEENILALDNEYLQISNSRENTRAAIIAVDLLKDFLANRQTISANDITQWLLVTVGDKTHKEWLKNNDAWLECQKKDFNQLPVSEAVRDFQVLSAIKTLTQPKAEKKLEVKSDAPRPR